MEVIGGLLAALIMLIIWAVVTTLGVLPGLMIWYGGYIVGEDRGREDWLPARILCGLGGTLAFVGWLASWWILGGSDDTLGIGGFPFNG